MGNDKKLIKDLRFLNKPLFTMAADRIAELSQENVQLREKLNFHTKLQPMDTAPKDKHFILKAQQKDGWVDFYRCYWREDSYGFYIDEGGTEISKQEFNLLGWLPMPEGTEGL
jgi:hypothetical protein